MYVLNIFEWLGKGIVFILPSFRNQKYILARILDVVCLFAFFDILIINNLLC